MTLVVEFLKTWGLYIEWYFIAGSVAMALLRTYTWFRDRRWRAEQEIWDKALRRPDQVTRWQETVLTWMKNSTLLLFALLFWPVVVPALVYEFVKAPSKFKEPEPADQFECKPNCLRKKTTPEAAEADSMVTDPMGRAPAVPFGHLNDGWRRFLEKREPGFEMWTFTVEGEEPYRPADVPWVQREGRRKGLAWVFNGKVKAEFLIEW